MDVICYSGIVVLCVFAYITINHGMHTAFAERLHSETLFFHLSIGEMTIRMMNYPCMVVKLVKIGKRNLRFLEPNLTKHYNLIPLFPLITQSLKKL